jgi:transketolase
MVDILAVLYDDILKFKADEPEFVDRDIFILSKGHTVLGYFATLYHFGYFSKEVFDTFQKNGSKLIAHPIKNLPLGVESSNGSLGQGISYASGMAMGYKKRGKDNRVFVMMGDGECNEGSVWEAAQLSAEFSLNNLVAIVDQNGYRNDGETAYKDGLKLSSMWAAFGWNTIEVDGHNYEEIHNAFKNALKEPSKPTAIIAKTIKGKGFSFMEANNDWHHNRITKSVYEQCIAEIEEE